jgi:hypothetical protein
MSESVFRVDKFAVPAAALPAFMEQLRRVQATLGTIAGCAQNLVLTQIEGTGEFNVVTMVEWTSAQAASAARGIMQKKYVEEGFDPVAFLQRLGVRADMGVYGSVPASVRGSG